MRHLTGIMAFRSNTLPQMDGFSCGILRIHDLYPGDGAGTNGATFALHMQAALIIQPLARFLKTWKKYVTETINFQARSAGLQETHSI